MFLLCSQWVLPVFTWSSVRTAASLDILDAWVEMVYPTSISPSVILSTPIYACIRDEFLFLLSWRRQWHPSPVLLPGKSHGWRSLVGCSSWGREESDTTEWIHFHFSLSCIGEGNGNPLQCSCLENPRDGGAWWALSMGLHRVGHNWSDLAAAAVSNWSTYFPK